MNILEALREVDVADLVRQRSEMQDSVSRFERDIKALDFAIVAARQAQGDARYLTGTISGVVWSHEAKAPKPEAVAVTETPVALEAPAVESPPVVESPVVQEAVKEWEPEPISIVPKKTAKPVAPCGKKIEDKPAAQPVALTIADRAKLYLESTDFASTMSLVAFLGLPDGRTLNTMLSADSRFMQDKRGFWGLVK